MKKFDTIFPTIIMLSFLLSSCATTVSEDDRTPVPLLTTADPELTSNTMDDSQESLTEFDEHIEPSPVAVTKAKKMVYAGTGQFIRPSKIRQKQPSMGAALNFNGANLQFENTDLLEVINIIMSTLGLDYILDPAVRGLVTFQSNHPLKKKDLLPIMETLLRMNGMAMTYVNNLYHIMPLSKAKKFGLIPQLGGYSQPLPHGYLVKAVVLQYIGAKEMADILKPMAPNSSIIRIDPLRNLMLLAGTSDEVSRLQETIYMFDVDWMAGLSVGIYPLKFVKVKDIISSLDKLLSVKGKGSALDGILRFIPIESVNSVMVVTPQKKYLTKVEEWIERLDLSGGDLENENVERLFVYRVKNGDAEELSNLLNELFSNKKKKSTSSTAPNRQRITLSSRLNRKKVKSNTKKRSKRGLNISDINVRIVADKANNSLLMTATPTDFKMLQSALEKLDIVPLQVLIEAKIYEVTLNNELKYGLQWFFNNQINSKYQGNTSFQNGLSEVAGSFNFALINTAEQIRALFTAIASKSLLKVVSAPSIMVLDNHAAKIQVGDQVPIATQQQQSLTGSTTTNTILNTIEYRDTGVVLEVTPRVNPGGLVVLEISQEVSNVREQTSSGVNSPTISTRNISSTVAVRDKQSIVLGGLIRTDGNDNNSGVPFLHDVPFLGTLFGNITEKNNRTELVVIITPKIVFNEKDITRVTNDYRNSMLRLEKEFKGQ